MRYPIGYSSIHVQFPCRDPTEEVLKNLLSLVPRWACLRQDCSFILRMVRRRAIVTLSLATRKHSSPAIPDILVLPHNHIVPFLIFKIFCLLCLNIRLLFSQRSWIGLRFEVSLPPSCCKWRPPVREQNPLSEQTEKSKTR